MSDRLALYATLGQISDLARAIDYHQGEIETMLLRQQELLAQAREMQRKLDNIESPESTD